MTLLKIEAAIVLAVWLWWLAEAWVGAMWEMLT